jgi:GxxExxY protein
MYKHGEKTEEIIKAFYTVYNRLGYGFLERVYENALCCELRSRGFQVEQQIPIAVYYNGFVVGDYYADLLVENCVIIEIKAVDILIEAHSAQLINYY